MEKNYLKPDYVFETSWEVCNKMGGIHTVLSTKASTMVENFGEQVIFIGPDIYTGSKLSPEFETDNTLFPEWKEMLLQEGLGVRTGRWKVVGKPIALLIDFSSFIPQKNNILSRFWELYKVDSLSGQWDYIESSLFGYAVGKVIESFYKCYLNVNHKVIAHFNEWMTGSGALYLKEKLPHVGTVFTTHATVVGRSLAGHGEPLHDKLQSYNADVRAHDLGVVAKHSMEKNCALNVDCFTTVSEITAQECAQFTGRKVDVVTPNGFESDFVPKGKEFDKRRQNARTQLKKVSEALLGHKIADDALFVANSGRYEYRNKGIDVFLDGLKNLNDQKDYKRETIVFVLIPANTYGARKDLMAKLNGENDKVLENPFLTHGLNDLGYDPIINKLQDIHLNNDKDDKVKLIFVPSYLNGDDGIFNLSYYDIIIGMDLTVFPSYYEPWGYTPLESLAFCIPTITTNLAGFGVWASQFSKGIEDGVAIINRNDHNNTETSLAIADTIARFAAISSSELKEIRKKAQMISTRVEWNLLFENYFKAYDFALMAVDSRKDKIGELKVEKRIHVKAEKSALPVWKKLFISSKLPQRIQSLHELSRNLWWTWNYQATELFESIDLETWYKCGKDPIKLLQRVSYDKLIELSEKTDFVEELDRVYAMFRQYMDRPQKTDPSIAYFSMEYGINDVLKIYSGGLGVLAGDYLKEASDSGVNMTAVGLLYKFGYFRQSVSVHGDQEANFDRQEFSNLPLTEVTGPDGNPIVLKMSPPGRTVYVKVWRADVGQIPLYLLDTDHERNNETDRHITHSLYGGDWENRLKQEILLGMGGIQLLDRLGIKTNLYHCNEGHAALINVSRLVKHVAKGRSFPEAMEIVRASSLFTTHTPVPAGHDKFDEDLIRVYFRHVPERLQISWDDFMALGRENPEDKHEKFSMSVLAVKTSQQINGVSWLHGEVSRNMFQHLWKGFFPEEVPIGHVTNGVHYGTWTSADFQRLYEEKFDKNFKNDLSNKDYWRQIQHVDDKDIWKVRTGLRTRLLNYVKKRMAANMAQSHSDPAQILEVLDAMDPNALTIGFARRFATYKRAHLLFTDEQRLSEIVNNPERPVQFLFAGKAHPADGGGQALIKRIVEISKKPEFLGKIIFLENYDMKLAKRLVTGVDIWLNTPTRPLEASGTSGEKAELNGVLNFSVLDGWWYEGYREGAGWSLSDKRVYGDQKHQDELDAAIIYGMLENEIVPLFYDKNEYGISRGWIQYIKNSISEIAPTYTTKRMMDDYLERFYLKMDSQVKELVKNDYAKVHDITAWKRKVKSNWNNVEVVNVDMPDIYTHQLGIGEIYKINLVIDLKALEGIDLSVQVIFAEVNSEGVAKMLSIEDFELVKREGSKLYFSIAHKLNIPGVYNFGIRMFPVNKDLNIQTDMSCVRWI
ncbi:phosphorylase / glycogen(starch) synthase [Saccharicrinis carchari]|uniref:Phosphorylase / glycogen(Starch) synthase n=1 Tax=Saccharicrinis carchari TaxID=1168039 RepID=A0A521C2U2_SACCC|nr:alpha-glucan family phosphorylase [Saccharicrinis carchari]SMO53806.1 phosphorylase / glycogen(starch) synthase [Saccharicrinis carchari]